MTPLAGRLVEEDATAAGTYRALCLCVFPRREPRLRGVPQTRQLPPLLTPSLPPPAPSPLIDFGVTAGERYFLYALLLVGFLFILLLKRDAISETRRRVTTRLREIDRQVDLDNYTQLVPPVY